MTPLNAFSLGLPEDAVVKDRALGGLYGFTNVQQMALFQAPSVAGWQAFYQAPLYNKLWLNSFTLPSRKLYTDALSNTGVPFGNYRLLVDPVLIAEKCDNPEDAEKLISQVSILFSPMDYATNQKTVLLEVLLGTDTRQQWTNKWNTYVADPTNTTKKQAVLVKLRSVFTYMMRMPEFHLS